MQLTERSSAVGDAVGKFSELGSVQLTEQAFDGCDLLGEFSELGSVQLTELIVLAM